jgi:hypothetical protein
MEIAVKPRIEKKLSRRLMAIFDGTRVFESAWIDDEYYRHAKIAWAEPLTSKQVRFNRECRVGVNRMPSIGGEADYWGEGTDYYTVYRVYTDMLWSEILYTDELCRLDCQTPRPMDGTLEHTEWTVQKAALLAHAGRAYRRVRPGNRLIGRAQLDAARTRQKEWDEARKPEEWRARKAA